MVSNKKIQGLQVLLVVFCLLFQGASALANDPQGDMRETVEKVMAILSDPALDGEERWHDRRERVSDEVAKRFDFAEMAKRALGKAWDDRTSAEQEKFVDLFKEVLKDTYVERLRSCCGGNYKVVFDKVIVRGDKAMVNSQITQGQREVSAAYKMYHEGNEWFVYDVVIEGVSLVSNYRSQFLSVINKEGYEELVQRLEKRIAESKASENIRKEST